MHPARLALRYVAVQYGLSMIAGLCPNAVAAAIHRLRGVRIGRNVMVDRSAYLDESFPELLTIEDGARICPRCVLVAHVSAGDTLKNLGLLPFMTAPIRIGAHAFIGSQSVILPGVTVGTCAVVGAGSVVCDDVPAYTLVAGNPARPIRSLRTGEPVERREADLG